MTGAQVSVDEDGNGLITLTVTSSVPDRLTAAIFVLPSEGTVSLAEGFLAPSPGVDQQKAVPGPPAEAIELPAATPVEFSVSGRGLVVTGFSAGEADRARLKLAFEVNGSVELVVPVQED